MPRKPPPHRPSPRSRGEGRAKGYVQAETAARGPLGRLARAPREAEASPHIGKGKSFRLRGD